MTTGLKTPLEMIVFARSLHLPSTIEISMEVYVNVFKVLSLLVQPALVEIFLTTESMSGLQKQLLMELVSVMKLVSIESYLERYADVTLLLAITLMKLLRLAFLMPAPMKDKIMEKSAGSIRLEK
jgi:hypothetical protein